MTKTYEDGLLDGVDFATRWEEIYTTERTVEPLTDDHVFGKSVLVMRPQRKLLAKSQNHLEKRIRAIQASALLNVGGD